MHTPLSAFCDFVQGGRHKLSSKHFVEVGFPAYGAGGMNGYLPDPEFDRSAVILSAIGARCGKCFLAEGRWSSLANTQLIFPDPRKADVHFIWYQLNDEGRWPRKGLAQPFIRPSDVKSHIVYLPPLKEQQRIAAILDKADELRRKRERIIGLVRSMPEALFLQMFGDPQANPGRWNRTSPLSDVAEIGSGITKGRKEPSTTLRSVPYLAVANVQDRALELNNIKTIEASDEEIRRFRLMSGDLVLTEGGDPDKLGRGTIWRDELPEAIHQNHIFRVRVDVNEIDPLYLNFLIGSEYGKRYFLRSAKQTTGIASINKSQLSRFPVLLPPLELQKKFAFEVQRLAVSQKCANRAGEATSELFSSLRQRAFSDQL